MINLSRLKSQLMTSGLQQKDLPLFQVINQLIDVIDKSLVNLDANLLNLNNVVNNISVTNNNTNLLGRLTGLLELGNGTGLDGEDGFPGEKGVRGIDGNQGIDGKKGIDGYNGIDGIDGEDGIGVAGARGIDGVAGSTGIPGSLGLSVLVEDGKDGEDGFPVPGLQGLTGSTGLQGLIGLPSNYFPNDGEDGQDGFPGVQIINIDSTPPGVEVYQSTDVALANATPTAITFNTEVVDDGDYWIVGAPTRLTIPKTGWYNIIGQVRVDPGATSGNIIAYIYVNGSEVAKTEIKLIDSITIQVSANLKLNTSDYIELFTQSITGSATTIKGGNHVTFIQLIKVAASTDIVNNRVVELLTIDQAAQPATLNVTTEGAIDWVVPNGTVTIPRLLYAGDLHSKTTGGFLALGFNWIVNGGTIFIQNDALQISNILSDDTANSVLTNSVASQGIYKNSGIGEGWRIQAPPSLDKVNTLKIYCGCFSAEVTITATLPSGLTVILTFDPGAAGVMARLITITYLSASILNVKAQVTVNHGSIPNVKFQCATLKGGDGTPGSLGLQGSQGIQGVQGIQGLMGPIGSILPLEDYTDSDIIFPPGLGTESPKFKSVTTTELTMNGLLNLKNYTVATLPAATRGDIAYVTDALAPTFLAALVGSGAVVAPAFYNGVAWVGF